MFLSAKAVRLQTEVGATRRVAPTEIWVAKADFVCLGTTLVG
jgi:hypothetical protein